MVFNALQKVDQQFGIEEFHRQFNQFDEEIRYKRDIDTSWNMQKYLGADKFDGGTAEKKHHLSQQHQPHKADILSPYTCIYNSLGEEREDKLQEWAE